MLKIFDKTALTDVFYAGFRQDSMFWLTSMPVKYSIYSGLMQISSGILSFGVFA